MAHIHGSGKDDFHLFGTSGDDTINGGKGSDFMSGEQGNDTLTGGQGADWFFFPDRDYNGDGIHDGDGHDTVTDFNPADGDVLDFYFGTLTDPMFTGALSDGMTFATDHMGTMTVTAIDANSDGVTDTQLAFDCGTIVDVLGWAPEDLTGQMLLGG